MSKRTGLLLAFAVMLAAQTSRAEMATLGLPALASPGEAAHAPATAAKPAMQALDAQAGVAILKPNLAAIPKGAKVYRADLVIARRVELTGAEDDARVDIEVYPLQADGKPDTAGKPLAPRAPWFDRLDATAAVQLWVEGKTEAGFFVKACPKWDAREVWLDVAYEGKPAHVPPPATGLKAIHRAGQTFITWKEIEDVAQADELTWRQMRPLLNNLDSERRVRYCIYRSDKPITADTLSQAQLLAEVKPLSGWNVNGRNVERPIDLFIAKEQVLNFHQGNPFEKASVEGQYGLDCPIDRLVIEDGAAPLARDAGLYVHSPDKDGKAYFAVITSVDGVQNTTALGKDNVAGPIDEKPGQGEPVLQRELPAGPIWDYPQKRLHYVQWVSPPLCNLPSRHFNWTVGVPEEPKTAGSEDREAVNAAAGPAASRPSGLAVPMELNLHREGRSYWRTQYRLERDAIVLQPHDFGPESLWYGYHERQGTLKSFNQGAIQPYTERRLLKFIDWAAKKWPVDRNRVSVTGVMWTAGSGALRLGLRHPDVFSLVVCGHGIPDARYIAQTLNTSGWTKGQFNAMEAAWGKVDWAVKADTGQDIWDELDVNRLLANAPPAQDLPLVSTTSADAWKPCHQLYLSMLEKGQAVRADFWWGGPRILPVSLSGAWPREARLDVRRDRLLPAFRSADTAEFLKKGGQGDFNTNFRWQADSVDKPDRCEVTLLVLTGGPPRKVPPTDVTLRRRQQFKPKPGQNVSWTAGKQSGQAAVGQDGVLTIPGVQITPEGVRLVVTAP